MLFWSNICAQISSPRERVHLCRHPEKKATFVLSPRIKINLCTCLKFVTQLFAVFVPLFSLCVVEPEAAKVPFFLDTSSLLILLKMNACVDICSSGASSSQAKLHHTHTFFYQIRETISSHLLLCPRYDDADAAGSDCSQIPFDCTKTPSPPSQHTFFKHMTPPSSHLGSISRRPPPLLARSNLVDHIPRRDQSNLVHKKEGEAVVGVVEYKFAELGTRRKIPPFSVGGGCMDSSFHRRGLEGDWN